MRQRAEYHDHGNNPAMRVPDRGEKFPDRNTAYTGFSGRDHWLRG